MAEIVVGPGAQDAVIVGSGDELRIEDGATFEGTALRVVQAPEEEAVEWFRVTVAGQAVASGDEAVIDGVSGVERHSGSWIEVAETGDLRAAAVAVDLTVHSTTKWDSTTFVNDGAIVGDQGAVRIEGPFLVRNGGVLRADGTAENPAPAVILARGEGVSPEGKVINRGEIVAGWAGAASDPEAAAIAVADEMELDIRNKAAGVIDAAGATALRGGEGWDYVINDGTILGDVALGGYRDTLYNYGSIGTASQPADVVLGDGDDLVWTYGTVAGQVDLGADDDRLEIGDPHHDPVIGESTVRGDVRLGPGEDVVKVKGRILGDLDLGSDDDKARLLARTDLAGDLRAGAGDDRIEIARTAAIDGSVFGGAGGDRFHFADAQAFAGALVGGTGDDVYFLDGEDAPEIVEAPGEGEDQIRTTFSMTAPDGIERLYVDKGVEEGLELNGNGLDNLLKGRGGNDELRGLDGADKIRGKGGDDVLVGGRGGDDMKGGGGADRFVWRATDEAGTEAGERDLVRGFDRGEDVLDFSRLGLDLAYQPDFFSGTAGEVRLARKDGDTRVRIDTDGDADGEMTIIVRGVADLSVDDLIF